MSRLLNRLCTSGIFTYKGINYIIDSSIRNEKFYKGRLVVITNTNDQILEVELLTSNKKVNIKPLNGNYWD